MSKIQQNQAKIGQKGEIGQRSSHKNEQAKTLLHGGWGTLS